MKKFLLISILCLICWGSAQTVQADDEMYSVFNESTGVLTFYFDSKRADRQGNGFIIEDLNKEDHYKDYAEKVVKAKFDASFANVRITDIWETSLFYGMYFENGWQSADLVNMKSIEGMEYFNTSEMTRMSGLFDGCKALESIDLSHFNTEKVTMMEHIFLNCESLTSLNVSSFNMANVESVTSMFEGCKALATIYCDDDWSVIPTSNDMFDGCESLIGGNGTVYDENCVDAAYAHPDGENGAKGYFTHTPATIYATFDGFTFRIHYDNLRSKRSGVVEDWKADEYGAKSMSEEQRKGVREAVIDPSMQDASPTRMWGWFYGFKNMTTIQNTEYLNTSDVTTMQNLFDNCSALTQLDLSRFDTRNVTAMGSMFYECNALKTIYCNEDWSGINSNGYMFYGCESLVGGNGTTFDAEHTDASYARPDGVDGNAGYFTTVQTALNTIQGDKAQSKKVLRDGQLLIKHGDRIYNVQGAEVR